MHKSFALLPIVLALLVPRQVYGQSKASLDEHLAELKAAGSLAALCRQQPAIRECQIAIGEWKPAQLEQAKLQAPICYDRCDVDVFGFYRDPESRRDIPAVRTKDFDGAAPSRGFDVTLYPVAIQVVRYEGCAGCALIYQYPMSVAINASGKSFVLPRLTREGFYMPAAARRALLSAPDQSVTLSVTTAEGDSVVRLSSKAHSAYRKMLRILSYDNIL